MSKRINLGKVDILVGTTDHWGFGIDYNHYERALSIDIIHWYLVIEQHYDWEKGNW